MARNQIQNEQLYRRKPGQYPNITGYGGLLRSGANTDEVAADTIGVAFPSQRGDVQQYSQYADLAHRPSFSRIGGLGPHDSTYGRNQGSSFGPSRLGSHDTLRPNYLRMSASPSTPRSVAGSDITSSRPGPSRRLPNRGNVVPTNKSRVAKSPKLRKPKAAKESSRAKIEKPLSVLTSHLDDIPIKDMEAHVHRSEEARKEEVKKKKGYITRPMNSFMLYRSAYSERTKALISDTNHQMVSTVSGQSWPLEPPEIRDKYNTLAKIERENHQKAHPEYKFSPSKTVLPAKKKKDGEPNDDGDGDGSDQDPEWTPGRRRIPVPPNDPASHSRMMQDSLNAAHHILPPNIEIWPEATNIPNYIFPAAQAYYGNYLFGPAHPYHGGDVHSEANFSETSTMQRPIEHEASLTGLPGGQHPELLPTTANQGQGQLHEEPNVDPKLLASGEQNYLEHPAAVVQFRQVQHSPPTGNDVLQYLPQYQEMAYPIEQYRNDPGPHFEHESEFNDWMEQEHMG